MPLFGGMGFGAMKLAAQGPINLPSTAEFQRLMAEARAKTARDKAARAAARKKKAEEEEAFIKGNAMNQGLTGRAQRQREVDLKKAMSASRMSKLKGVVPGLPVMAKPKNVRNVNTSLVVSTAVASIATLGMVEKSVKAKKGIKQAQATRKKRSSKTRSGSVVTTKKKNDSIKKSKPKSTKKDSSGSVVKSTKKKAKKGGKKMSILGDMKDKLMSPLGVAAVGGTAAAVGVGALVASRRSSSRRRSAMTTVKKKIKNNHLAEARYYAASNKPGDWRRAEKHLAAARRVR